MAKVSDEQVFEAAIETIQKEGYAGATTKKIAAAAGIHEVTLFRRFNSKAELLAQTMQREAEAFGTKSGVRCTGNLQADLLRVLSAYSQLLQRRGSLIPILIAELPRHPELAPILDSPRQILGNIATMVRRYQERGELIDEDPMVSVSALIAPLVLPKLLGQYAPLPVQADLDLDAHVHAFLEGRRSCER